MACYCGVCAIRIGSAPENDGSFSVSGDFQGWDHAKDGRVLISDTCESCGSILRVAVAKAASEIAAQPGVAARIAQLIMTLRAAEQRIADLEKERPEFLWYVRDIEDLTYLTVAFFHLEPRCEIELWDRNPQLMQLFATEKEARAALDDCDSERWLRDRLKVFRMNPYDGYQCGDCNRWFPVRAPELEDSCDFCWAKRHAEYFTKVFTQPQTTSEET